MGFLFYRKVVIGLNKWLPKGETLKLVFERQDEFSPLILHMWELFKKDETRLVDRISGIEFVDKESTYYTEPADYLAFQLKEYYMDKDNLSDKARMGLSIMGDLEATFVIGGEYLVDELRELSRRAATATILKSLRRNEQTAKRWYGV